MLASSGIPSTLDGWVAEPKLDGWRARILLDTDGLRVRTRSERDITANVHGLDRLAGSGLRLVLDGELVVGGGRLADFYKGRSHPGPAPPRARPDHGVRGVRRGVARR